MIKIVYEDKDILVCFKPAGIPTQTASLAAEDMVSLLKKHLAKAGKEKNPYLGLIHRLDQPVSGLLVFAKNKQAAGNLSKQFVDGAANKDYIALACGMLEKKEGKLEHDLIKDSVSKQAKVVISGTDQAAKKAVLEYRVEKEEKNASIVKVKLHTGRFHQIRAQFSTIGNPLLGDRKYGSKESIALSQNLGISQIALCAYKLKIKHPTTGKQMEFMVSNEDLPKWYRKQ